MHNLTLKSIYRPGQTWMLLSNNCKWVPLTGEPVWESPREYRLHRHSDLIEAHKKGSTIQMRIGPWMAYNWIDVKTPTWDEDAHYRLKPEAEPFVHQSLIDSYQKGQIWQFRSRDTDGWLLVDGQPSWFPDAEYRLHPHSECIQAYKNGAQIEWWHDRSGWIANDSIGWFAHIKYRIKPEHKQNAHRTLIESYQIGQAWQRRAGHESSWANIRDINNVWLEPQWLFNYEYRLHPQNDLIQAHENGAVLQVFDGDVWVTMTDTIGWYADMQYRIKPEEVEKPKTKIVHEWMIRKHGTWTIDVNLYTEDEATDAFSAEFIVSYQKTGRSWELPQ
jgi:hypothetical protein